MGNNKNEIIINGKRYDAATGHLLDREATKKASPHHTTTPTVIDGIKKPRTSKAPTKQASAKQVHGQVERSKTLMRGSVQKPAPPKIHAKATAKPKSHHTPKTNPSHFQTPAERLRRADSVPKSHMISKFGPPIAGSPHKHAVKITTAVLPVREAPSQPPPLNSHHKLAAANHHGTANPFEKALEKATSHQQKPHKQARLHHRAAHKLRISPRTLSVGAFVSAGFLLSGFMTYQNIPNLAMRLAGDRAGLSAAIPGYHPAGFSLKGPIQYSPGQVIVKYKSTSDERAFDVFQKKSAWNSQTLRQKFVANTDRSYQTYENNGRVVYVYGESNATWVDGGVWYQIEGNSALSSEQLLRIASSL